MFVLSETEEGGATSADRACWCALTAGPMGPDGKLVTVAECRPGRSCHEPR
jgi:hypothetical protein